MKKYSYFVSFVFMVKDTYIYENITITTKNKIETIEQIREIEKGIYNQFKDKFEKSGIKEEDVMTTVLNYQIMKEEEE